MIESRNAKKMINLRNKSIVVTGGTKGIGVEITKSFLKQNSRVFVLARQNRKGLSKQEEIKPYLLNVT